MQHFITTIEVVHGNMHALTEYLLLLSVGSLVVPITRGVIMSTKCFTSEGLVAMNEDITSKYL
jgi:hypothetical protein